MATSIMLAKIMGVYFVILGLCMWSDCKQFKQRWMALKPNSDALFIAGFFELLIGILVVLNHNVWIQSWPVIITIVGYLLILEAVMMLANPQGLCEMYKKLCSGNGFVIMKVVMLVIGLVLVMAGFYDFKFCF